MKVLSCLIWAASSYVAVLITVQCYLPRLMSSLEGHEEMGNRSLLLGTVHLPFWIIYVVSVSVAVLCGWASSIRGDTWINVFKMIVTCGVLNMAAIIDLKLYRIPNPLILIFVMGRGLSFVAELIFDNQLLVWGMWNSVIAGGISLLLFFLISKITHGGIGYGDVKLFSALGFLCGMRAVIYTVILSFLLCSVVAALLLVTKKKGRKDGLPLAPFVWMGFAATVVMGLC